MENRNLNRAANDISGNVESIVNQLIEEIENLEKDNNTKDLQLEELRDKINDLENQVEELKS